NVWINGKNTKKPNTKTNAKLVVFLCRLWLEGSVKIKMGRGSMHLKGLGQRGLTLDGGSNTAGMMMMMKGLEAMMNRLMRVILS
ncbi:hypothetical protein PISMIDRAFT_687626, partial [Pisolithus microcarpus 441]